MVGAKGQRQAVLNYLLDGNRITSQKAFKLFGAIKFIMEAYIPPAIPPKKAPAPKAYSL